MSVPSAVALEVLGLPSFASFDDIIFKYKTLAFFWYPEKHNNCSVALDRFRSINEAVLSLLKPEALQEPMKLIDMYQLFQNIFFGGSEICSDCDEDEGEGEEFHSMSDIAADESADKKVELKASDTASQLIFEEEQEKLKAERKRAKKKRRKERKKQQKVESENVQKQNVKDKPLTKSGKESKDKVKEVVEEQSSDSEEEIDTDSAFVAVIAKRHKNLVVPEPKKIENSSNPLLTTEIKEDPSSIVLRSRQLALRANEMASLGHYSEAINLFSESIKLDPTDHRFYGNRSYCFDRLGQNERALKDAEKSIALCPSWPKGYYRKGRALLGLKKFAQAEECFVKVLKLDNDCEDAISELHKVKILQIMELGYSKKQAETALADHSSVQESIESLLASGISKLKTTDEVEVFISDDENDGFWSTHLSKPSQSPQYDIKMDPKNPESHVSLWIGNVQPDVSEKKLATLFSKYGELLSVKVMPEKYCAFINFKNKNAPGKAMQAYQGLELHGANLIIRFPNLPGEVPAKKKQGAIQDPTKPKITTDECYFWRTTGCIYGENCRNRHVKEHKGIDKKKWHVVS